MICRSTASRLDAAGFGRRKLREILYSLRHQKDGSYDAVKQQESRIVRIPRFGAKSVDEFVTPRLKQ